MFKHGFPPEWSTFKKLIWLVGSGIAGAASGVWKTVTGTLIHITDALASPMQKCEVSLEPIQDLHGQDAPYPAGGGKQLFDIDNPLFSAVQVGYLTSYGSKVEDGKLYNGGQKGITSGSGITIPAEEGNYTLSFYINGESATFEVRAVTLNQDNSWATYTVIYSHMGDDITGQQTVTVAFPSGYTHLFFSVFSATKYGSWETNVMIEKGSTASPWQPFANICPITGWTGCEVTRAGENLLGGQTFAEAFSSCNGYSIDTTNKTFTFKRSGQIVSPIKFKDNTQYTFIFTALADVRNNNIRIHYTDGTNTWVDINTTTKSKIVAVSTSGKTVSAISVAWGVYSDTATVWYEESGIFEGVLTADDFEPYSGTTLSVTFPDTVYGGKYEFVSGEGNETGFLDVFNEENTDGRLMSSIFIEPSGASATVLGDTIRLGFNKRETFPNVNFSSNTYPKYVSNLLKHYFAFNSDTPHWYINSQCYLFLPVSLAGTTQESAIAYLKGLITAGTPLSIWIPYVEPVPFAVTPQPISTLAGENNVWSNSNGETTLIYKA